MADATPVTALDLVRAVIAIAVMISFTMVGRAVGRRRVSPDAKLANGMFQTWWYGFACLSLITPLVPILKILRLDTFDVYLPLIEVLFIIIFGAIAGLVYYLLYLYTGRRWLLVPVLGFYAGLLAWLQVILVKLAPVGYGVPTVACPGTDPKMPAFLNDAGAATCGDAGMTLWFGVLLSGPIILAAMAYFLLFFRTDDKTARFRIGVISGSLIAWFGASLVGTVGGFSQNQAWSILQQIIALAAGLAVLMAYKPPAMVQKMFGVEAVSSDG